MSADISGLLMAIENKIICLIVEHERYYTNIDMQLCKHYVGPKIIVPLKLYNEKNPSEELINNCTAIS